MKASARKRETRDEEGKTSVDILLATVILNDAGRSHT